MARLIVVCFVVGRRAMARLYKVDDYLKHLFFLNFFAFPYSPKGKIPIFASVLHTKTTGQQPVHIELTLLFSKSEIWKISCTENKHSGQFTL